MKKLLIATTNAGKFAEFKKYLGDVPLELVSLSDLGITQDFVEKGKTYAENSRGKAEFYAKLSGLPSLSDDGGIEIDFLGGAPGIHSKRWVGIDSTDEKILKKMEEVSRSLPQNNRNARFVAVITIAFPDREVLQETGIVEGVISEKPRNPLIKGFPYRSYFYLPQIQKYYHDADLSEKEEKLYNHRYKAIQKLKPQLLRLIVTNS